MSCRMLFWKPWLLLAFLLALPPMTYAQEISLEDLWLSGIYFPSSADQFRWMQDDAYYTVLEETAEGQLLSQYRISDSQREQVLLNVSELDLGLQDESARVEEYSFSKDESKVLLKAEVSPIYRHSSVEYCFVYDLEHKKLIPIALGTKVSLADFSPDASQVLYVSDNNLYLQHLGDGSVVSVTQDGERNAIINGMTDWVYEEEFAFTQAYAWSEDGKYISYLRFDEREVPEYFLPFYGGVYPYPYRYKYPKAGEKNSEVSVWVFNLETGKTEEILGSGTDDYYPYMKWLDEGHLAILQLNRFQNEIHLLELEIAQQSMDTLIIEKSDTYIDEPTESKITPILDGDKLLWLSEREGYQHIYLYDRKSEELKALTQGEFEVREILKTDDKRKKIYFLSTENSPLERQLYVVDYSGKNKKQITRQAGTHEVSFSSSATYFVDAYSDVESVEQTVLCKASGEVISVLEDNARLKAQMEQLSINSMELISLPLENAGTLNGYMIKPPNFDPSRKYPLLMFTYGGPGSQRVNNAWGSGSPTNYIWHQLLAQKGYIVACVDNRGTGGRGKTFRDQTYLQLGKYETEDQIEAARYFQQQSYVDSERIGIWGWSYGGFLTASCLSKGKGIFKMGIAVSPVTHWRFYDTIYTERYMRTPQANPQGYNDNSPLFMVEDLQGKMLLVHGTGDDNVHFQNSMQYVNELIRANKHVETFFYPNRNHGIYGGNTRYHLFTKLTDFVIANL